MMQASKTRTGADRRKKLYSKGSDLSKKRTRLLKLQALAARRSRLLSEMNAISEQIRVLERAVAEDLADFRR
jgi:hypothetical protein